MQFSCKSPLNCNATSKQLQLFWLLGMLVVCTFVSSAGSSSCPSPCTPSDCPVLDCQYRYRDICDCCEVCARGPGDLCEGLWNQYGYCATGLECVKTIEEGLPQQQQDQLPGTCTVVPSTAVPTTLPLTNGSVHTTTQESHNVTTPQPPTSYTTTPADTTTPALQCRRECSVTYCDGKNRVCSAKGIEFAPSSSRNSCQHTSCHACVLLVSPSGCDNISCGEPPTKACLRTYYKCIEAHYFSTSSGMRVLTLHDPEAALVMQQGRGRIVCHVVDLLQTANND